MDASILIQGLGLAAVVGAMIWDMRGHGSAAGQGWARAEVASAAQRCPFCHEDYEGLAGSVHCKTCGTRHHAECWTAHGGCTVLGCHSDLVRAPEEPPEEAPEEEAPAPEALTDPTPCG